MAEFLKRQEELRLLLDGNVEGRSNLITKSIDQIRRAKSEAFACETEWNRLWDKTRKEGDSTEEDEAKRLNKRMELLNLARCEQIARVAAAARRILVLVAGDLTIDETTAGTGLSEVDRRRISDIAGTGEELP